MVHLALACFPISHKKWSFRGPYHVEKYFDGMVNTIGFFWHPRAPLEPATPPPPQPHLVWFVKFRFFGNRTLAREAFCHGPFSPSMFPHQPQKWSFRGPYHVEKYFDGMVNTIGVFGIPGPPRGQLPPPPAPFGLVRKIPFLWKQEPGKGGFLSWSIHP